MNTRYLLTTLIMMAAISCGPSVDNVAKFKETGECPEGMKVEDKICVQQVIEENKVFDRNQGELYCDEKFQGRLPSPEEVKTLSKNKKYLDNVKYITSESGMVAYMYEDDIGDGFGLHEHMSTVKMRVRCVLP